MAPLPRTPAGTHKGASEWVKGWALVVGRQDLNLRPTGYEPAALTT